MKINTPRLYATMDRMLSESSRSRSHTHCVISFIYDSKISKTNAWCSTSRWGLPMAAGGGGREGRNSGKEVGRGSEVLSRPRCWVQRCVQVVKFIELLAFVTCAPFFIGRLLYFNKIAKNYKYSKHEIIHSKIDFEKWLWGLWYLVSVLLFWNNETKHVIGEKLLG